MIVGLERIFEKEKNLKNIDWVLLFGKEIKYRKKIWQQVPLDLI